MRHPTCAGRWRRGVGVSPRANALRNARCVERGWARALLRHPLLGLGSLPYERLLLFLGHVFNTRPHRTSIGPTGGSRRAAACSADGDEPPFLRSTAGLTFPLLGRIATGRLGLTTPPPHWWAAELRFASLLPPLGRATGLFTESPLPPLGRAADVRLASLLPPLGRAAGFKPELPLPPLGRAADMRLAMGMAWTGASFLREAADSSLGALRRCSSSGEFGRRFCPAMGASSAATSPKS